MNDVNVTASAVSTRVPPPPSTPASVMEPPAPPPTEKFEKSSPARWLGNTRQTLASIFSRAVPAALRPTPAPSREELADAVREKFASEAQKAHLELAVQDATVNAAVSLVAAGGASGPALQSTLLDLAWRVVAASPKNPDNAVLDNMAGYVDNSKTVAGKTLKADGLVRMLTANPTVSAEVIGAIASIVNNSSSLEGRELKVDALANILTASPNISADTLGAMGRLVNESNSLEGRSMKLDCLQRIVKAKPNIPAADIDAIADYVNESSSIEIRTAKFESLARIIVDSPHTDARRIQTMARIVNASRSSECRELKIEQLEKLLMKHRCVDASTLDHIADLVLDSSSEDGYTMKFSAADRVLDKHAASADECLRDLLSLSRNGDNNWREKQAKINGYLDMREAHADLSADVRQAVMDTVNNSDCIDGYNLKYNGVERILTLRPQADASFLRRITSFVDGANGVPRRAIRMNGIIEVLTADPHILSEGDLTDIISKAYGVPQKQEGAYLHEAASQRRPATTSEVPA